MAIRLLFILLYSPDFIQLYSYRHEAPLTFFPAHPFASQRRAGSTPTPPACRSAYYSDTAGRYAQGLRLWGRLRLRLP